MTEFPINTDRWLPPPGGRQEHVVAIIEATTGRPLPCHLRILREQRDRMVAEAKEALKEALGIKQTKRKPSTRTLVKRAESATGKTVTAITTTADGGTKLDLGTGKPEPAAPENPWPLDEFRTKENKR